MNQRVKTKIYIMVAVTVIMWGSLAIISALLLNTMDNMQVLAIGATIASATLAVYCGITGKWKNISMYSFKNFIQLIGLGLLGNCIYTVLYYYGLSVLPTQDACIINYLWPIMTVVFACIILKEKLSLRRCIAMLISFGGVVCIAAKDGGFGGNMSLETGLGILSCVLCATAYGAFSILNKKMGRDQSINNCVYFGVTAVFGWIYLLATGASIHLDTMQILGFIWLGVFVDALGYVLWAMALQASEAGSIANFAYATPVISMVFSVILLHEEISLLSIAGLIMIIGSFLIQLAPENQI